MMASAQFDSGFGWLHCLRMAKTVEIPDELHEALEARARAEGVSVPDMVARELGMMIPKRPLNEIIDEVLRAAEDSCRVEHRRHPSRVARPAPR
jgi:hypothetical protein